MVRCSAEWEIPPTKPLPPASVDFDFFLDLRLSTLRHDNTMFPRHNDIYTLVCRVYASLNPSRMVNYSLQETYVLAVSNQRHLRDDLAKDTVTLCDLVHQAPLLPAVNQWIANALNEVPRSKLTRILVS